MGLIFGFLVNRPGLTFGIAIHFLPVYNPSLEEISDPQLYCHNVQTLISRKSGVPISEFYAENALENGSIIIYLQTF